jgi:Lipocalin-like domain
MTRALAPVDMPVPSASGHAEIRSEELYGTWRLVSFTQKILATGETVDVFGKAPQGVIHYGRDGRMIVLMVKDARPKPSDLSKMSDQERIELFKTLVAYAGTYTVESKTVRHHLDISWNQIFTGTDQVRNIEFDGCKFIMSTNPQPRSQDGEMATSVLTWERLE